tara:strand:+ start:328 stop:846 length:519 start_codon:yes stop_codon:yes gene_type:complete
MYLDVNEYWKEVLREVRDPETASVLFSSYGIYAGISHTGDNTAKMYGFTQTHQKILDESNNGKKIIFLLSESDPVICKPDCPDCIAASKKRDDRMMAHTATWPEVSWNLTRDHHLKAVIIRKKDGTLTGFSGGRNFTTSEWRDVSFRLTEDDAKTLLVYLIDVIKTKSKKLN